MEAYAAETNTISDRLDQESKDFKEKEVKLKQTEQNLNGMSKTLWR